MTGTTKQYKILSIYKIHTLFSERNEGMIHYIHVDVVVVVVDVVVVVVHGYRFFQDLNIFSQAPS